MVSQVGWSRTWAGLARGLVSQVGWSRRWALSGPDDPGRVNLVGERLDGSLGQPSKQTQTFALNPGKSYRLVTVQIGDGHP